jgi:hypothetical protein
MLSGVTGLIFLTFLFLQPQATPANPPDKTAPPTTTATPPADQPETPAPVTCPAGTAIGAINLKVRSQKSPDPLPFQTINHLSEGDIVLYSPIIKGKQKRVGEVALVMVPAKKDPKGPQLLVTEPKPADKPQEWKIPQTIELAAFVYGPGGLSRKKVEGFLSQDDQLVAQLADYAAKTSETEALLAALSNDGSSAAGMNAALNGFASQYGLSVQIDRTAPPAVQAQTLFATMNPQLATYNPLATSSSAERLGQTASLATAAATLFFGSPIGLAAGGTAMLLDLRYIAFPNTVFRSSFAQIMPSKGVNLCGQGGALPPRTRIAYIWASRIPNTPDPEIKIKDADYIPQSLKTPVPVDVPDKEWKYLERARQWSLVNDKGVKTKINVIKLGNQHSLEVDLDKVALAAGDYKLHGFWDWSEFEAKGEIHVRPLSDFKDAHLLAASQDKLLAHSGKVAVTLADNDFEFTQKVEEKKLGDEFAVAEPVRFILPTGLNKGPQNKIDVQIDTANLDPGKYQLLIAQEDGKSHPVPFNILPNAPKIENLPILINQGVDTQHFVLKGERLQLISRLESPLADLQLAPASPDGAERSLTVQLKGNLSPGKSEAIQAYMSDRSEPLTLADALQITGPLPVIASSKLSLPTGMQITLLPNEFPAGATLTALLDVKNIKPQSVLHLDCQEATGARPALHIGEQNATSSLQQLSPDQLFVSFDTSAFPAGCTLLASIDNGKDGKSQPQVLAHIIRLPQIATFQMVSPQSYQLTGLNLEMIQKVGWDATTGTAVPGLPSPIPGQGQQQSLLINLPDPPNPKATLYIWLHGEPTGRATTITLPQTPAQSP